MLRIMTGKVGKSRALSELCKKENFDVVFVYYPTPISFAELEYVGIKVFHCNPEKSYESLVEFVWDLKNHVPFGKLAVYANLPYSSKSERKNTDSVLQKLGEFAKAEGADVIITVQDNQEDSIRIYEPKFLA